MDGAVEHMRAPVADAHRVSIGWRMGHPTYASAAGGASNILDYDRLPKFGTHGFRNGPCKRVKRTSGSKRHNKHYWLGRVSTGHGRGDAGKRRKRCSEIMLPHVPFSCTMQGLR